MSAYCINESPDTHCAKSGPSSRTSFPPINDESRSANPVFSLDGYRGNHSVAYPSPVYTTAKANWRQLIAEKGSFDGGVRLLQRASVRFRTVQRVNMGRHLHTGATFKAALTERCFRYLDCFNGDMVSGWSPVFGAKARNAKPEHHGSVTFKAVYLSSQLDRKTDFAEQDIAPDHDRSGESYKMSWLKVCGTQTKQGGCLYEQPVVNSLGGGITEDQVVQLRSISAVKPSSKRCHHLFWQKPGIGMAAVSPVPLRETIRKRKSVPGIGYR